jgi:uncharacterized protein (DUF1499 family)
MTQPTLPPCPATPNCVSSQAKPDDTEHYLPPIPYQIDSKDVIATVREVMTEQPRHTLIEERPDYLKVELRSFVFRFVDELEFVVDDSAKLVHFRSAARLGRGDFGVNRRRMTRISEVLRKHLNP